MPSNFIELEDVLAEAEASGKSRTVFQAELFQALRNGSIAAHAMESIRTAVETKWCASIEAAAAGFGWSKRIQNGIRHAISKPGYSSFLTKSGFITVAQQGDGFDLYHDIGAITKSHDVEIKPRHWAFAEYSENNGNKLLVVDDIDLYRIIFTGVSLNRVDYTRSQILNIKRTEKKRTGPKGTLSEKIVAKALDLLNEQPDISKVFFDAKVWEWLEAEGLAPAPSTYHAHYGVLRTRHVQGR